MEFHKGGTYCTPNKRRIFFELNFKDLYKSFRPTMGVSLIRYFSGNRNKKLKFIVHFLPFLKTVPWNVRTLKQTSFWAITNRFGLAQQEKIVLETNELT